MELDSPDSGEESTWTSDPERETGAGTHWDPTGARRTRKSSSPSSAVDIMPRLSDPGLRLGFRILKDLMHRCRSTFLVDHPMHCGRLDVLDYDRVIVKPMWLKEVKRRFVAEEYESVAQFVSDVRLILANIYRYFGPNDEETVSALNLEDVLNTHVTFLPSPFRDQCLSVLTEGLDDVKEVNKDYGIRSSIWKKHHAEYLERCEKREEELKKIKEKATSGHYFKALEWERNFLFSAPEAKEIKLMWEIPSLGLLIQLTRESLGLDISQAELERMFLIPEKSHTLAKLMTYLLSPTDSWTKLHLHPTMPYSVWNERVKSKTSLWISKSSTMNMWGSNTMFEEYGLEPKFWKVMGQNWKSGDFHLYSLQQRVWVVKSIFESRIHTSIGVKSGHIISHSQTQREENTVLGEDRFGRQLVFLKPFLDGLGPNACLRVYRCSSNDSQLLVDTDDCSSNQYELVVDSIKSLRNLIETYQEEDENVPLVNLIKARRHVQLRHRLSELLSNLSGFENILENNFMNICLKMYFECRVGKSPAESNNIKDAESFWLSRHGEEDASKKCLRSSEYLPVLDFDVTNKYQNNNKRYLRSSSRTIQTPKPDEDPQMFPKDLFIRHGNMFVVLDSDAVVCIATDDEGKVIIPANLNLLSSLHGKTLNELVQSGFFNPKEKAVKSLKPRKTSVPEVVDLTNEDNPTSTMTAIQL